ncbi:MAG: arylsulfotransferase family protein [Pseudomonadota bacterium]
MEEFLFKKVKFEVWAILAGAIGLLIAMVMFGFVAQKRAISPASNYAGPVGRFVENLVAFPGLVGRVFSQQTDRHVASVLSHDLEAGFTIVNGADTPNYILISRYDGNQKRSGIDLVDEATKEIVHSQWFSDVKAFEYDVRYPGFQDQVTADPSTMRLIHPLLTEDGGTVLHFTNSPLYRLDACGNEVWRNTSFAFHHSLEQDHAGNFWVPGTGLDPLNTDGFDPKMTTFENFRNDHLVQVSPDGETLFAKSVLDMLAENGLYNRVYNYISYKPDPIHLNDVQPVLDDGAYWKRGDVFLSIGHLNMVVLYRPSEDRLIWWSQERTMYQHDVDIIDSQRISIFDNRRTYGAAGMYTLSHNELLIYDFETDTLSPVFGDQFDALAIETISQGLVHWGPDASVMIEETNSGRLVKLNPGGDVAWQYANRADNGTPYTLNWSRYVPRGDGDKIVASLAGAVCE